MLNGNAIDNNQQISSPMDLNKKNEGYAKGLDDLEPFGNKEAWKEFFTEGFESQGRSWSFISERVFYNDKTILNYIAGEKNLATSEQVYKILSELSNEDQYRDVSGIGNSYLLIWKVGLGLPLKDADLEHIKELEKIVPARPAELFLIATRSGNMQAMQKLLELGVDINVPPASFTMIEKQTALHVITIPDEECVGRVQLTKEEKQKIVQFLLEKGASVIQKDAYGKMPLHYAKSQPELNKLLDGLTIKSEFTHEEYSTACTLLTLSSNSSSKECDMKFTPLV